MNSINNHPLYRKHNIDSAMNAIWDFYRSRFTMLFIISFFISLALQFASSMVDITELQNITDPELLISKLGDFILPFSVILVINLLFSVILQHYVIFNPLDKSNTIFHSAWRSLKYFIPYLIIMVLLAFVGGIAMLLGVFVLIIGAFFAMLYFMTIYMFILPVLMIEDNLIGLTINRSFSLAHKHFWQNIGWVAVFFVILLVISVVLSAIILIPFSGGFLKSILDPSKAAGLNEITRKPLYIILSAAAGALTLPLLPVFSCVIYFTAIAEEEEEETKVSEIHEENRPVRVEDLYAKPYSDDHPENPDKKQEAE